MCIRRFRPLPSLRYGGIGTLFNIMEQGLADFLFKYYTGEYFKTIYLRGGFLIFDNFRLQEGIPGYALALLFSLFVIALFALALYSYKGRLKNAEKNGHVKTLITFMICSAAVFFLIPESASGIQFLVCTIFCFYFYFTYTAWKHSLLKQV